MLSSRIVIEFENGYLMGYLSGIVGVRSALMQRSVALLSLNCSGWCWEKQVKPMV